MYFLNVTASNELATPRLQSSVLVTITVIENKNYAPIFDEDQYSFNVSENAEIGVTIGSVSASDVNQVLTSHYSWIASLALPTMSTTSHLLVISSFHNVSDQLSFISSNYVSIPSPPCFPHLLCNVYHLTSSCDLFIP